jgi:hypothetical protein
MLFNKNKNNNLLPCKIIGHECKASVKQNPCLEAPIPIIGHLYTIFVIKIKYNILTGK